MWLAASSLVALNMHYVHKFLADDSPESNSCNIPVLLATCRNVHILFPFYFLLSFLFILPRIEKEKWLAQVLEHS